MPAFFRAMQRVTELSLRKGANIAIPDHFYRMSSEIIRDGLFCQSQIQKIIYSVYDTQVHRAGHTIKEIPSPKSRLEFIESYNDIGGDVVLSTIFKYAKGLFIDVYDLRNVLVHDAWASSDSFPKTLLLISLDEEARLLFSSGKLKHIEGVTSENTYKSIIRYINSVNMVTEDDLFDARKAIQICNWCLMQIDFCLEEADTDKQSEIKRAFFTFKGVSHLFPDESRTSEVVVHSSKKSHSINI